MDHRDDQQPQAPDLAGSLHLDNAETLDGPAGDADALDAGYVPADRPYGLDEDGVTGTGMRDGDSLDERLRREQPESLPVDADRAGRLVRPEGGPAPDTDGMDAVDVGTDGGAASAEEAAVHGVDVDRTQTGPSLANAPQLADPEADAEVAEAAAPGDPARDDALRDLRDDEPARRIDAASDAGGAAAAAHGRDDVGPGSGR